MPRAKRGEHGEDFSPQAESNGIQNGLEPYIHVRFKPIFCLSRNPVMRQAYTGFPSCSGQRRGIQRAATLSWHSRLASFLRFMAANLSFTQLDTWAKPLY